MEPYCIRPFRKKTPCPALMSSPVKTTSPRGSTTRSGIGGCPEYARYARRPSTKKPNNTTSPTACTQPLDTSSSRRPEPPTILTLLPPNRPPQGPATPRDSRGRVTSLPTRLNYYYIGNLFQTK